VSKRSTGVIFLIVLLVAAYVLRGRIAVGNRPDARLRLSRSLESMVSDGTFGVYANDSLYSSVADEGVTFTVPGSAVGPGTCANGRATITVAPAKTSGRLQESDVAGSFGWVVARVENASDCIPDGIYSVMAPKSKAALVARPLQSRGFQAQILPFHAPRMDGARLQFCDHGTGLRVDRVRHYLFDVLREAPCDALKAKQARQAVGDGTASEFDGATELLVMSCGLDDCVITVPPRRSRTQSPRA